MPSPFVRRHLYRELLFKRVQHNDFQPTECIVQALRLGVQFGLQPSMPTICLDVSQDLVLAGKEHVNGRCSGGKKLLIETTNHFLHHIH